MIHVNLSYIESGKLSLPDAGKITLFQDCPQTNLFISSLCLWPLPSSAPPSPSSLRTWGLLYLCHLASPCLCPSPCPGSGLCPRNTSCTPRPSLCFCSAPCGGCSPSCSRGVSGQGCSERSCDPLHRVSLRSSCSQCRAACPGGRRSGSCTCRLRPPCSA